MMRYGIPGFRTPRDVLDAEIQRILDLGVKTRMKCKVGKDITLEQIRKDFNAVFLGLGALYQIYLGGMVGQTLGKRLMGLRVISVRGLPPSPPRAAWDRRRHARRPKSRNSAKLDRALPRL